MAEVTLKALLLGDDFSASRALKGVAREIDGVAERLVALNRLDATPEVKIKTAEAQAELARLQAEMDALGTETEKVGKKSEHSSKQVGALATAIVTLGPALVPIAAGATALAAGWGAMGAAGVLAFVGIRQQMAMGTATGTAFSAGMDTLKGNLRDLGAIAARGVLKPFQSTVADLQARMPVLSGLVGEFSVMTGRTAANLTGGMLAAFVALAPLMRDVGVYTLTLSQRFQAMMSGPGVVAFGEYARSVFPQVMQAVESIVQAAVHLVAAFAPLGLGTLSTLRMLSDLISAIPVDVLAVVAQLAGSVFLGFRAWQALSGPVGALNDRLRATGPLTQSAATGMRALQIASGVIGVALAGLSLVMSHNAEANRANQQAVNDMKDALIQSNGALDEHVRKVQYDNLVSSGAMDTYKALGGNVRDLVDASLGYASAQGVVNDVLGRAKPAADDFGAAGVVVNGQVVALTDATGKVRGAVFGANEQLKAGRTAANDYATATAGAADATNNAGTAAQTLASKYGVSLATYQAAADSQNKTADAAAAAMLKMQLENDAAGILKQSLDQLNGKAISAADAQNAFDSSLANMGDHVTATGKKIHFTTTNIGDMSAASVALRGQLNGQVSNLERVVEANGGLSNSTGKAREQMLKMRQQIIDNAVAHGVDREAVTKYIDKLLKIPKSIPPTKLQVDSGQAVSKIQQVLNMLAGIHNKSVDVTVNYLNAANKPKVGHNAQGTSFWEGGLTWVGESGRELVDLPPGSRIFSNPQSEAMVASSARAIAASPSTMSSGGVGGGDIYLTAVLKAPDGSVMQKELLKFKRTTGAPLGLA